MPANTQPNLFALLKGLLLDGVNNISGAGAPTDGTTGVYSRSGKGSLYYDITNGFVYINTGTAAAPVWLKVGGTGFQNILSTEVSCTNAEILALRATPKTLVAAPGAGKVLQFLGATLLYDFAVAAHTAGAGDDLAIRLNNAGTLTTVSQTVEATGLVTAAADTMSFANPVGTALGNPIVSKANGENMPLVLHNIGGAEFGGGNAGAALRVKTLYTVWNTGF